MQRNKASSELSRQQYSQYFDMLPRTRVEFLRIIRFSLEINFSNRGKQLSSSSSFLFALPLRKATRNISNSVKHGRMKIYFLCIIATKTVLYQDKKDVICMLQPLGP